jgi:phosphate:Na+ symporter
VGFWLRHVRPYLGEPATLVVMFHLTLQPAWWAGVHRLHAGGGRLGQQMAAEPGPHAGIRGRPHHLDPSALATPSLAISCAAREALHQADMVETMLVGMLKVIKDNDLQAGRGPAQDGRHGGRAVLGHQVLPDQDLARGPGRAAKGRRWTDIISFTINMEQIGDIIERVLIDIEDKKIKKGRKFSRPAWPRSASCTPGWWTTCAWA